MPYAETIDKFADLAKAKAEYMRKHPFGFFVASMMAGAYVGIGILLIFSVGDGIDPSARKLVMGGSFGIALTLVVFAGSELFTGHTMYMTYGLLRLRIGWADLSGVWALGWFGNLCGAFLLGLIFVMGGSDILLQTDGLLYQVAAKKMAGVPSELIARAMLCNWLVCLALWTAARTENDVAKCILIFWCLFAFIASGFEHSVANMTIFSIALLSDHPATISFAGAAYNLVWVTLGNIISGVVFMGAGYWVAEGRTDASERRGQNQPNL